MVRGKRLFAAHGHGWNYRGGQEFEHGISPVIFEFIAA
jgi:hypothetical protein